MRAEIRKLRAEMEDLRQMYKAALAQQSTLPSSATSPERAALTSSGGGRSLQAPASPSGERRAELGATATVPVPSQLQPPPPPPPPHHPKGLVHFSSSSSSSSSSGSGCSEHSGSEFHGEHSAEVSGSPSSSTTWSQPISDQNEQAHRPDTQTAQTSKKRKVSSSSSTTTTTTTQMKTLAAAAHPTEEGGEGDSSALGEGAGAAPRPHTPTRRRVERPIHTRPDSSPEVTLQRLMQAVQRARVRTMEVTANAQTTAPAAVRAKRAEQPHVATIPSSHTTYSAPEQEERKPFK